MLPEVHVDLSQAPANRWQLSSDLQSQAKHLLDSYVADLGGIGQYSGLATSGGRYERAMQRLGQHLPTTADECLATLRDPDIQLGITVKQMIFSAGTGTASVWLP